jgi:hypothetical protein
MDVTDSRNPRLEAQALMPEGYTARVLEPSPPAVHEGEFSDDPTDPSDSRGKQVVSPVSSGDLTWRDFVTHRPHLEDWAQERWLGPWPRLKPVPSGFAETRIALHQLSYFCLSPARHRANTKIGLRFTKGGFGTPFFGDDVQIRTEGDVLIVQRGKSAESTTITSLSAACSAVGIPFNPDWFRFRDTLPAPDVDQPLPISGEAARAVASVFAFGAATLEELRATASKPDLASLVQIWPEHFDVAVELGDPEGGQRASYGISPGDDHHPEPYLYVSAWGVIDRANPAWNDPHFNGASVPYSELVEAEDQREFALAFYQRMKVVLRS